MSAVNRTPTARVHWEPATKRAASLEPGDRLVTGPGTAHTVKRAGKVRGLMFVHVEGLSYPLAIVPDGTVTLRKES